MGSEVSREGGRPAELENWGKCGPTGQTSPLGAELTVGLERRLTGLRGVQAGSRPSRENRKSPCPTLRETSCEASRPPLLQHP